MIHKLLLLVLTIILFAACNNEVDLSEKFKEIPVVYGILNAKDTAQYIRIERVFNSEGESALDLAKNTDSLYYSNITVLLKDAVTAKEFVLEKVDGNTDKRVREKGVFATDPNYLYKIKTNKIGIKPNRKYILTILDKKQDTLTQGSVTIVDDLSIYIPSSNEKPVKLAYISNFNVNWEGGINAGYYDVLITFNIREKDLTGSNIWINKSFTWKAGTFITEQKLRLIGEDFYKFIGKTLESKENIKRRFSDFDITVKGVGKEMKDFIDILHFDSGIASSQQLPTYTNMSYGYGVLSSQNSVVSKTFLLDDVARDSIRTGVYTKKLNFE